MIAFLTLSILSAQAAATVKASSTLKGVDGTFPAALAFDGLLKTGWAEGVAGSGEGQWLELDLGTATAIQTISVWPGNIKDGDRSFKEFGRPKVLQVLVDGKPFGGQVSVEDEVQRIDVPVGASGRVVRVQVDRAYEGGVYSDLFIAEVAIDFGQPPANPKLQTWLDSTAGKAAHDAYVAEIEKAYASHKETEFGDRDAFAFIADAAAEGAPYLRKSVQTLVPLGYRAQAIPSDDTAREALRKLKDSNAIPALSLAALRSSGSRQKAIQEEQQIFEAYQAMLNGGGRNVPEWGASGYEPGALQSLGEPLPIEVDRWGDFLVADIGNNRIQQLTDEGRFKKQWGKPADDPALKAALTDAWFKNGRPWYASGAAAGEEAGAFVNPLDVVVLPQKKVDWWAAIDARKRVQVFDESGKTLISWTVTSDNMPRPGLGGEVYLAWVPAKKVLVTIIQDEAIAYTLEAEEVARFTIRDGIPTAVEALKNGAILMAFGDEVIQYNADGFRYGKVIGSDDLGEGFEDLDLTVDEKGKVWALTDTGWIFKWKTPGNLEFKVRGVNHSLKGPRIAVRDGFLYFTADDHIEHVDAYQAKNDAEDALAAEEGGDESGEKEAKKDKSGADKGKEKSP
jgi:hypothetical protein